MLCAHSRELLKVGILDSRIPGKSDVRRGTHIVPKPQTNAGYLRFMREPRRGAKSTDSHRCAIYPSWEEKLNASFNIQIEKVTNLTPIVNTNSTNN